MNKRRDDVLEIEVEVRGAKVQIYSVFKRTKLWYHVTRADGTVYVSPDHDRALIMIDKLLRDIQETIGEKSA
jgi:hypothetical protein